MSNISYSYMPVTSIFTSERYPFPTVGDLWINNSFTGNQFRKPVPDHTLNRSKNSGYSRKLTDIRIRDEIQYKGEMDLAPAPDIDKVPNFTEILFRIRIIFLFIQIRRIHMEVDRDPVPGNQIYFVLYKILWLLLDHKKKPAGEKLSVYCTSSV